MMGSVENSGERRTSLIMSLPQHSRTSKGNFRKARADERAGNLAKDYPEFELVDPRTKLGTLRQVFDVTSITDVRRELRKRRG